MLLDRLSHDARYAMRSLIRTPVFTAVAVLTLALGIGANTAMFSILYGVLLRPLPYRDAGRLAIIEREQDLTGAHRPVPVLFNSPAEIDAWQQRLRAFVSTAVYSTEVSALATDEGTDVIDSAVVSSTFFPTLSGHIAAGRPLDATDNSNAAVVISNRLAQRVFGGAPRAVGQPLTLSFRAYTVVGVAESDFQFPTAKTDAWIPVGFVRSVSARCCSFRMFGRLKDGVTIAAAAIDAAATADAIASSSPPPRAQLRTTVIGLRDQVVGAVRPALLVLFAAVGLVLLVACANIVNLLLARHVATERDAAIRSALGATRFRLLQQSIAESTLLATTGALAGIGMATAIVRLLTYWPPPGLPRLDAVHIDMPVLSFSIALGAMAAFAAGLLPGWQSANTAEALRFGAASTTSAPSARRIRQLLCAAELAISLVLLIGASLLGRSLVRLMRTDLGVTTDHVVTATLNFGFGQRPPDAQTVERVERIIDGLRTLPGVRSIGAGTALPPNASRLRLTLRKPGEAVGYQAAGVAATPEYFQALGMRLVSGRFFTNDDDVNHPAVMIMSVDTATRFFGPGDPLGRTLLLPVLRDGVQRNAEMTLVGVVSNVKYSGLDAPADDAVYRPFRQQALLAPFLVVRTAGDPRAILPVVGREIAAIDRGVIVADVRALDTIVSDAAAQPRFRTAVLVAIATLAVVMAIVGLYGVIAYSVAQRTREIGIRVALGAHRRDVVGMVLREGLRLAVAGIVAGAIGALAASRILSGLLYGIAATDPASFVLAGGALLVVALFAAYIPARRAMRVDPLVALRCE
jgi:putative ABC transport system permease protein